MSDWPWPLPKEYRALGVTGDSCPYCDTAFVKRPGRKTKCRNCGNHVYVRTRPLDGARVLLTSDAAQELERDWALHYEIESAKPRGISPEWRDRIDRWRRAVPSEDPEVEAEAQRIFSAALQRCRDGDAPRDAFEALLRDLGGEKREAIVDRVESLKTQMVFGRDSSLS